MRIYEFMSDRNLNNLANFLKLEGFVVQKHQRIKDEHI